ncbi:putative chromosome-associated kinesin KIF4B [Xylogone sp. PMI_703]|nr:putative chromosome-associated kinesin KIF4B [Xylogone sp. PMI_703]
MASPPGSPAAVPSRPMSAIMRPARTTSRMSMSSKVGGGGSRASDEDGKTSVKVAIRVRPPLRPTDPGYELIPQRFQRAIVQVTSPTSLTIDSPQGKKLFVFDRVFSEDVGQAGIWEYLEESTTAFVQGYNVSLLAYGQSGAGKSYTMGTSGPLDQHNMEAMGVIPRAATALFEKLDGGKSSGNRGSMSGLRTPLKYATTPNLASRPSDKNWTLKATYVEIYNEQLRDLLIPDHIPLHERGQVTIREDTKGHILLTNLHSVEINCVEDLMNALNFGSTIRQTDSTAINAKSSRSHAVFSLNLVQRKNKYQTTGKAEKRFSVPLEAMSGAEAMVTIDSKLHFVDLAGSERLKNTGAQGERAKEGISINAGLASLGKVISQLSSRQAGAHVSYRDSKLTRLLQDSLGGNAITYMIACVTPAEFHMSETLNTVQYAQRARAIQSKPRIQQVNDDSDKNALIERLKAEVAFLREQIRSTEHGDDRRTHSTAEKAERQNEREIELQNQLLDFQENYTALSQRHAKLIAEMARARDEEADNHALEETLGDSATERLKRSNSFAEAVEQVVLEYEKTIQSLEQSLSNTRSSLSATETALLEKETKCAYVETVNQQLQSRLQKMMDRESSTENYLHDLEARLDGHTSGEEKNSAIVVELRKEIARVRENEAACEDYISTLEERLAEADQDAELMQREIERLEHVVERQRSLGKLDNLLYELDHIQQESKPTETEKTMSPEPFTNGRHGPHSRHQSLASRRSRKDTILETEDEDSDEHSRPISLARTASQGPRDNGEPIDEIVEEKELPPAPTDNEYPSHSTSQSKFIEDKLENVTQELFDLKVEHETTVNEYDLLAAKYEEALRTLAELQDAVDEARYSGNRDSLPSVSTPATRPASFLVDARVADLKDAGGQFTSSRSLLSELSSAGELPSTLIEQQSEREATMKKLESKDEEVITNGNTSITANDEALAQEIESLRLLAAEKEEAQRELAEKYAQLEEQHVEALDLVEELKTEVSKAKMNMSNDSGSPRSGTPVIRRKSSQNVMIIDRAHRSFATLRNIAAESFEDQPDIMANFELNLNTAMHELHARSERVQELEADISAVKKEMETKMTIISGLTRERSSMKSSPMDISVVSTMQDQLVQSENQIKILQEQIASREKELLEQVEALRASVEAQAAAAIDPKILEEKEEELREKNKKLEDKKVEELEAELKSWESKHEDALKSKKASEEQLSSTIVELEQQLSVANAQSRAQDDTTNDILRDLQKEIREQKAAVATHTARVAELEQSHATAQEQLDQATAARDTASRERDAAIETHKQLVSSLEQQIAEIVKAHQDGLSLLHATHTKQIEEIQATSHSEHEARFAALTAQYQEDIDSLEADLDEAREHLTKVASEIASALGVEVSLETLHDRVRDLIEAHKALFVEQQKSSELEKHVVDLSTINDSVMKDLETAKTEVAALLLETEEGTRIKAEHATISEQLAAVKKEMHDLETKNKKNSRLVEELEDQLATNFDQHQATNNRLSTLQTERNAQLEEANARQIALQAELTTIKEDYAALQAKMEAMESTAVGTHRSNSVTGGTTLHKTASVTSLPSPPPAIPLPPIPSGANGTISPPPGNRPTSKDIALAQIQEDQEARIRTIEKHLQAEKQLTSTLEEALTDLERQSNKVKADCDAWRRRATDLEQELKDLKEKEKNNDAEKESRWSMQQVEEERKKRRDAEIARAHLEERMNAINKKKKKGSLNCF